MAVVELGILLALACALVTNVAFLAKHKGANEAPAVSMRHPLASARALFRSRWWTIGFAIAAVGWALHVAAMAFAPLSTVQAVTAGGLVLLAYPAQRWFGIELGRREYAGLILAAVGLALLALAIQGGGHHSSGYSASAMIAFEAAALGLGVGLLLSGTNADCHIRGGMLLGISGGVLIGVSDVALKALADTVPSNPMAVFSPWTAVALTAGLVAFLGIARGLQTGTAIAVITLTSVATNVAAVIGGIIVFGDPMGGSALEIGVRSLSFAALIAAAALMPSPIKPTAAHA